MTQPTRSALVVEDDPDTSSLIEFTLRTQGFSVTCTETGTEGVRLMRELQPDLVTLDLGLPGQDGTETCRQIREFSDAYIVMITARDDEIDRLLALETGADDYLTKPFSVRELKARVNALFRRPRGFDRRGVAASAVNQAPQPLDHEVLESGRLRVDVEGRRAFRAADELALTRTEFDLLCELMRTPGRVWTREALLRSVWDTEWATDTHLVEVHVGNLRRKLGDDATRITTVRGVGYRLEREA
ncbi:response regulator transcription factor [Nocardioides acrostichi]|uniref:Response regulator transcription factor n=1 Tax=Nocardioides acrostichi TaxID=2784339 RepID=A0A930V2Y4_9ACTN|nr:response regulator transcription factor [Nocardioides acrostichi]MBF4162780.1 response regulator transcription factor [Nocardioides acrostichi]